MKILPNCGQLIIKESDTEGLGVFATDNISAGTVLEEVPFVLFPRHTNVSKGIFDLMRSNGFVNPQELYFENLRNNLGFKDPERYYFKWSPKHKLENDSTYTVLPLGFGPIYNSSNTNNNANWIIKDSTFAFIAARDISKDEEIKTFYGYFLSENGEIFNCERVFYMALDNVESDIGDVKKTHKLKSLRFGSIDSLESQKGNIHAHKINGLINSSVDGLTIKSITLISSSSTEISKMDVPLNSSILNVYRRLQDAHSHPCPLIKFVFAYRERGSQNNREEEVLWKK